jgi:hypothetical protein
VASPDRRARQERSSRRSHPAPRPVSRIPSQSGKNPGPGPRAAAQGGHEAGSSSKRFGRWPLLSGCLAVAQSWRRGGDSFCFGMRLGLCRRRSPWPSPGLPLVLPLPEARGSPALGGLDASESLPIAGRIIIFTVAVLLTNFKCRGPERSKRWETHLLRTGRFGGCLVEPPPHAQHSAGAPVSPCQVSSLKALSAWRLRRSIVDSRYTSDETVFVCLSQSSANASSSCLPHESGFAPWNSWAMLGRNQTSGE